VGESRESLTPVPPELSGTFAPRPALNLSAAVHTYQPAIMDVADMSDESKLRQWAAEAARQAKAEKDADEARRLASFAHYWNRLADLEEWRRDNHAA
jgi:hypothetical protein